METGYRFSVIEIPRNGEFQFPQLASFVLTPQNKCFYSAIQECTSMAHCIACLIIVTSYHFWGILIPWKSADWIPWRHFSSLGLLPLFYHGVPWWIWVSILVINSTPRTAFSSSKRRWINRGRWIFSLFLTSTTKWTIIGIFNSQKKKAGIFPLWANDWLVYIMEIDVIDNLLLAWFH